MTLIAKSTDLNSKDEITITSSTQIDAYDLQDPDCYLLIGGVWYVIKVTQELLDLLEQLGTPKGTYDSTKRKSKHRPK